MAESRVKATVAVIGAGIGGLFMAILLAKRGFKVEVYERATEKDLIGYAHTRSFTVTFYGFGVDALNRAGIWEAVAPVLLPLAGAATQISPNSAYIYNSFDFDTSKYFAVSRADLLRTLLKVAKETGGVAFHFDRRLESINRETKTMTVVSDAGSSKAIKCEVIIGADGVNSAVREAIQRGQKADHAHEFAPLTYKQIIFPAELARKLELHPAKSYTWSRKSVSIIGHPELDGAFGAIVMVTKDSGGFEVLNSEDKIRNLIKEQFPLLVPAEDTIAHDLMTNPESHFVSIKTSPWYDHGFMTIVGDAAHGFYPFFGQGTSAAFGDCLEIVDLLEKYDSDWESVFAKYQETRKKNTDIVCEMSKATMDLYLRSTRANYGAIYDKVDSVLHSVLPKLFMPSLPHLIAHDPGRAVDYTDKHAKQRRNLNMAGMSFAVKAVTQLVRLQEKFLRV